MYLIPSYSSHKAILQKQVNTYAVSAVIGVINSFTELHWAAPEFHIEKKTILKFPDDLCPFKKIKIVNPDLPPRPFVMICRQHQRYQE